jgi:hypothetical protein
MEISLNERVIDRRHRKNSWDKSAKMYIELIYVTAININICYFFT